MAEQCGRADIPGGAPTRGELRSLPILEKEQAVWFIKVLKTRSITERVWLIR
jgi:hypothetical protein